MEQENVFLDDINGEAEVKPDKVDAIQTLAKKKAELVGELLPSSFD